MMAETFIASASYKPTNMTVPLGCRDTELEAQQVINEYIEDRLKEKPDLDLALFSFTIYRLEV